MTRVAGYRGLSYPTTKRPRQLVVIQDDGSKHDEAVFLNEVRALAALLGWDRDLAYHTFDSRRSTPGFPDLVLVRPPRLIFAELKVGKNTLQPPQKKWRTALLRCPGVEYYCWRRPYGVPLHGPALDAIVRILR